MTAYPNCKLKITWLKINNASTLPSPKIPITNTAGIMATKRVISLLIQGFNLNFKYPSITICPAKVPVTVELWPAAINAMANNMGAIFEPNKGANKAWASSILATSLWPVV